MTPRRRASDQEPWFLRYWAVLVGILLAGMWLGAQQAEISNLKSQHAYEHGTYDLPKGQ